MKVNIKLTRAENVGYYGLVNGASVLIDIEDYLCGVVPSEVYESRTPHEALKAQAIAARTYAVWKMNSGSVLDDTSNTQNYYATLADSNPRCAQAVYDTAGLVLMYDGAPCAAYYSRTNSGETRLPESRGWRAFPYFASRVDPWDLAAHAEARAKGNTIKASHGIGLSQVGAEYAANTGVSCEKILAFYFPGAIITSLEGEKTMAKPKASAVCATSIACAKKQPPITYVWGKESATQQDCQGHIEYCVRENGGSMNYAGSNDMFRNAVSWYGTIAEAKAKGYYVPGALLFQVKPGGDYPEKYHSDGKGNAQHIGYLIAGLQGIEIVHASSSAKQVTTGTMNSSWNYLGLAKAIDYSEYIGGTTDNSASAPAADQEVVAGAMVGVVTADGSGLNMRETPGKDGKYMLKIPPAAQITILETDHHDGDPWGKTSWIKDGQTFIGWVMMSFVELHREEATKAKTLTVAIPVADEAIAQQLMSLYAGAYLMEVQG